MKRALLCISLSLAACATVPATPPAPVEIGIIAINDFHGALEPPRLCAARREIRECHRAALDLEDERPVPRRGIGDDADQVGREPRRLRLDLLEMTADALPSVRPSACQRGRGNTARKWTKAAGHQHASQP